MDVRRTYDRLAARYDERWSHYVVATARETLERLPATAHRVLDVGCGTGTLLGLVRSRYPGANLFGVDLSSRMLEIAAGKVDADLRVADAEDLPFEDGAFDLVVCANVFHFFTKPRTALGEFRRVLRPGGTLVMTDWCHDYLTCRICDWVLRRFDRSYHRVYSSRECQDLLPPGAAIDRYKISWLWGLMTARYREPSLSRHDAC